MFKTILTDVLRRGAKQQDQEIRPTHQSPPTRNRLHLGCGANVLDGWLNVDLEPGAGVYVLDLRQPLPFADLSIDLIFNEHFIEHIDRHEALGMV